MKFIQRIFFFVALFNISAAFADVDDCQCTECDPTPGVQCIAGNGNTYVDQQQCFNTDFSCGNIPIEDNLTLLISFGFLLIFALVFRSKIKSVYQMAYSVSWYKFNK